MGSAFAPVLCAMVANTTEFIMLKHCRESLRSSGLLSGFRYADHRAFLLSTLNRGNDWRRLLLNLEFYGLPILLENVPGEELLGVTCSTQQGAIVVRQPLDATLLRALQSVGSGSRKFVLSGFRARVLAIMQLTRPVALTPPQVEDLIEIHQGRNFPKQQLVQLASLSLRSMGLRL